MDYAGNAEEQVELAQDAADTGDSDLSAADLTEAASLGGLAGDDAGAAIQGQADANAVSPSSGDPASLGETSPVVADADVDGSAVAALEGGDTAVEGAQEGDQGSGSRAGPTGGTASQPAGADGPTPAEADDESESSFVDFGEDYEGDPSVNSISLSTSLSLVSGGSTYQSSDSGLASSADLIDQSYVPVDPPPAQEWGPNWDDESVGTISGDQGVTPGDPGVPPDDPGVPPDDPGVPPDDPGVPPDDPGVPPDDPGVPQPDDPVTPDDPGVTPDGGDSYDGGYGGGESYEAPVEDPVESAPVETGGGDDS